MALKKCTLPFITLFMMATLPCCYSPKIFLSKEEQRFADSLANVYSADVNLQHDYKAIKENKKNGQFWIELKNAQHQNFCSVDSLLIKEIASNIATRFSKIMKYKPNYNSIEIVFIKSEFPDKQTENTICEKHVIVNTKNPSTAQITYWH
ncbi:hypothetical protein SAMN05660909_04281 [Chitinophaga terrae (ex Kim and Jung 2007)]|uniref:Uncharacterized protein n=1 Tax=Chitinophaga terrae (ex Kim and Jung 2007) TaxID=408074 RepID=A0A1H4FC11_9BACT|nr:hypothetical protein [Chitinophaga terrae (ex Kim and Jung 2007)]GEP92266.1 hypothetical protein CTE07_39110 [Chitinophaga terrae (ex Kim and Jung 2007)]SEA94268.1 hypothetical protein SAMN05660909_04281 [Chitinophaga terrae (ex Kim and Jung 2007)]